MDCRSARASVQLNQRAQFHFESAPIDIRIDGEVHGDFAALTGQVNDCLAQWAVERVARRASVVRTVFSEIGTASSGSIRLSDADIARSAHGMLQAITLLPAGSVEVVVDGGWITLSGSVHSSYQKDAATAAIRHVIGATGVTVRVTVVDIGPTPATRPPFWTLLGLRLSAPHSQESP